MRKVLFILALVVIFIPNFLHAQESNAGFIPSNLWYSEDPFEEGDKVKIYTLIFNSDPRQMSGTVSFFDKNILLGKKDFIVPGKSMRDVSIDWNVTVGSHVIFAKIDNAKFLTSPGKYETAYLDQTTTDESRRTVSKKVISSEDSEEAGSTLKTNKQIQSLVVSNTPEFIAKPVIAAVTALEKFRENQANSDAKTSLVFENRYVFYGILLIAVFFVLRFIWRLIF